MAELAQAYIHLKPYGAPEHKLKALGRSAERLAIKNARRIYNGGVDVIVELEEGSLRTRITVVGALALGAFSTVADYSGFKQSVRELCEDAQIFSESICAPFTKKANASDDQIFRFERRLKTPGKLKRLNQRLERLQRQASDLSSKNMAQELAAARHELEQIASDLSASELEAVTKVISPRSLPPPSRWPEPEPPRVGVHRPEHQEPMFEIPLSEKTEPIRRMIYHSRTTIPAGRTKKKNPIKPQPSLLAPK